MISGGDAGESARRHMPGRADEVVDQGRDAGADGDRDQRHAAAAEAGDEADEQGREGEIRADALGIAEERAEEGARAPRTTSSSPTARCP